MSTQKEEQSILHDAASVRAVAVLFSELADAYNARLKVEAPQLNSVEVYARLQEEQRMRSISNQLYFEAADRILNVAGESQAALEEVLKKSKRRLKKMEDWAAALDLIADLLVLAGAVLARKPGPILAALKEVRDDIKSGTADA
ncbi:MAG: hypothetical protein C4535_20365 [Comamonadaceae bacterium]|nr:MAG: hypothetical protein C4535_20365 [Comamonadaceae bacterium]